MGGKGQSEEGSRTGSKELSVCAYVCVCVRLCMYVYESIIWDNK